MKTGKLDEYAVKARLFPAFLALLPLGICAAQFIGFGSAVAAACSAFGGTALLSFVLAQWSRDAGKSKEHALYERWGRQAYDCLSASSGGEYSAKKSRPQDLYLQVHL
jgi:hypothetical protein